MSLVVVAIAIALNAPLDVYKRQNDSLLEIPPLILTVQRAELRKFNDMMQYNRNSDWAVVTWEIK